jgi:hypothetical protein
MFVAYSTKQEGSEDNDYRGRIGERGHPFAGAKGVGRFSCDRLGARLRLESRATHCPVQILDIDWPLYEGHPKQEFGNILVDLSDRDRGTPRDATPPTPPGIRVRTNGGSIELGLSGRIDSGKTERLEIVVA